MDTMSKTVIPKREATPGPWKYGVREDGSMWISIGDPMRKHSQFDWYGFEEDLELACRAPELEAKVAELETARDRAFRSYDQAMESADKGDQREDVLRAKIAEQAATIGELKKLLVGASLALRSYQGFTGSTADAIDAALSKQVKHG
jgi:hypothetical protein